MAKNQKAKGSRLEYKVRDELNKAFGTKAFQRTPGSGAFMGKSNYARNAQLDEGAKMALGGDIICPEWFRFSVECKNYADYPLYHRMLSSEDRSLDKWINETIFDANNFGLTPMVVFQTTYKGTFIAIPDQFINVVWSCNINPYLLYKNFIVFNFDDFIQNAEEFSDYNNHIDGEIVKKYYKLEESSLFSIDI